MVYISDGALEEMVAEKLRNRFWLVSANVVNHPLLSPVHAHRGALHAFIQENNYDNLSVHDSVEWRTKKTAPVVVPWTPEFVTERNDSIAENLHQWAPLVTDPPATGVQTLAQQDMRFGYEPFDPCSLKSWKCATVAHYSLFQNLEEG